MAEGIDVYGKYQTVTDWGKVRAAGKEFAYIKVSDGETDRDDYGYAHQAKSAGVAPGGYHYAQFGDPVSQAKRLLKRVRDEGALDLAPALDLEAPFQPNQAAVNFSQSFLDEIASEGETPCLYGNNSMLSYVLPRLRFPAGGYRWCARYSASRPTVAHEVWQYSQNGRVAGIVQNTDLNSGTIPWNSDETYNGYTGGAEVAGVSVRLQAGKNQHIAIPCAGVPHFLYIAAAFDDQFDLLQMDFARPTPKSSGDPDFVPGKGFHAGDDGLGNGGNPWRIKPNRSGPMPDIAKGFTDFGAVAQVSLRWNSNHDVMAFIG